MADQEPGSEAVSRGVQRQHLVVPHSAYYTVLTPETAGEAPPPLLIVLHGYGQKADKFIKPFAALRDRGLLVVAPQGPNAFYWQETRGVGFAWLTRFEKEQALVDLLGYMRLLFNDLGKKYPYDPERVFLFGFSQGAVLAFRVAASGVAKVRAMVTCGSDLPADVAERIDDLDRLPVMVVHGEHDDRIPVAKAEEAVAILESHGFPVTRHFFDGGHDLSPEVIEAISAWIAEQNG